MKRLIEIRAYRLKAGTHAQFDEAMHGLAVPMLRAAGMDVVAYGKSEHEEETYFLIRSYVSRKALEDEQRVFYGSDAWRNGPRSELVSRIETYVNTLLWVDEQGLNGLRALNARAHEKGVSK